MEAARQVRTEPIAPNLSRVKAALRRFLSRIARKILRRGPVAVKGLLEGLSMEEIAAISAGRFGFTPSRVSHLKLSSWKRTGSYRVYLRAGTGAVKSLVFKDACYSRENIPALTGLPVKPGFSEFFVYAEADGTLSEYLPEIYLCERIETELRYRYLLEDLSVRFRADHGPEAHLHAARELPRLHRALGRWNRTHHSAGLPVYGKAFSETILPYVRERLDAYADATGNTAARAILEIWSELESGLSESYPGLSLTLIHGDYNISNIWSGSDGRLKVVDWEWAGLGFPQMDLASLLKHASPELESAALAAYIESDGTLAPEEQIRVYRRCLLERTLLDAAFISVQAIRTGWSSRMNLPKFVDAALLRAISAFRTLRAP